MTKAMTEVLKDLICVGNPDVRPCEKNKWKAVKKLEDLGIIELKPWDVMGIRYYRFSFKLTEHAKSFYTDGRNL